LITCRRKLLFLLWWAAALGWAGLIFWLSTPSFGPHWSGRLLALGLRLVHLRLSPQAFELLNVMLRKLAHVTEYGIFALLLYTRAGSDEQRLWRPRHAALCIAAAFAYSLSDELHQRFAPGRHASIFDCGIDSLGASIAMLAPYLNSKPWRGVKG